MKKIIQILLCLLVSSTMLVSCGEDVGPTTYVAPQREAVNFDEMADCDFDEEVFSNAVQEMTTLSSQKHSLKKIKEAYDTAIDQYDRLVSENDYYYTAYVCDVTDEDAFNKQNELSLLMTDLNDDLYVALFNVLHSDYRDDMITYINNDIIVQEADEYSALEDDYLDLLDEENTLIQKYNNLDVAGSTDLTEYEQIYLDLIDNRIAQMGYINDYDSYTEYAYDQIYHRDYKPEDLDEFREWAKQVWPVRNLIVNAIYSDKFNIDAYNTLNLSQEEIINRVQPYVSTISEEAASTFEMMVNYNLIDISASDTKAQMAYTTTLNYYGVPYIFSCPDGTSYDVENVIHEFGHYYEMYENMGPRFYEIDCYDTAEVNSQGMEVLMLEYANEIFGDEIADTQRLCVMGDLIGIITIGCVYDEFQQEAFEQREEGTLTSADQLTDLYISIEKSYTGGYTVYGENWYHIVHTFDSPFYYISYATSAAAALGLFSIAEEDRDQAISIYNDLTMMGCQQGFVNSLETVGIPNPFSAEDETKISDAFTKYVNELIAKHQ